MVRGGQGAGVGLQDEGSAGGPGGRGPVGKGSGGEVGGEGVGGSDHWFTAGVNSHSLSPLSPLPFSISSLDTAWH